MSNTGKTYSEEFRRDAVALLQSSGRPVSQVARELGVNVNSLRTWRNRILGQSGAESLGAVGDKATSLWMTGRKHSGMLYFIVL